MIVLFTDYGLDGPYLGQLHTVLHRYAPGEKVINLLADAPANDPRASAYLLPAFSAGLPAGAICLAVVDPGVGSFTDAPVIIRTGEHWYVGPDNGLFDLVCRHAARPGCWRIDWRPTGLSCSFHGRDLYAPVAAQLAAGTINGTPVDWQDRHGWPDDLYEIVYVDHFGNCMTGIRNGVLEQESVLSVNGRTLRHAGYFAAVPPGTPFWYENSQGLVEVAVNTGSAAQELGLTTGMAVLS